MALADDVGSKWSVGIDGRGYIVSTLDQESPFEYRAFTQQAVPLRLPRIDTSPEPGEASLGDLWVRSQHDWSEGMGQRVFDGLNSIRIKAHDIGGYDPFIIEGRLTATPALGVTSMSAMGIGMSIGDHVYCFGGTPTVLHRFKEDFTSETRTIRARFGAHLSHLHNFTADGQYLYWATDIGIHRILTTEAFGSWTATEVKINDLINCTVLLWGKGRLIACRLNDVHIINDLSELADGSAAHYSNQDSSWVWTDADDLSQGIYLSGHSAAESKLYLMSFDTTDAAAGLTIGIPREVWRASDDEKILTVKPYAGSAMLLGTSRGVRNCTVVDREGNVSVGPLIETAPNVPVHAIGVSGRYAFYFHGSAAGYTQSTNRIAKLDLSTFAVAAAFTANAPQDTAHGLSIIIPSWYQEWQPPIAVVTKSGAGGVPIGSYPRQPSDTAVIASEPGIEIGDITFGTSVLKELKRVDFELDASKFAFSRNSNNVRTSPANTVGGVVTLIARMALKSWTGGPSTLFYQGPSKTDFHWRVRLLADRKIEFSYLDDLDAINTATSDALPSGWNVDQIVWILTQWTGSQVTFHYIIEAGDSSLVPFPRWLEDKWTSFGTDTISGSGIWKGGATYGDGPIVLYEETPTAVGDLLFSFHIWDSFWFITPEKRYASFNAVFYAPDSEGNTWDLATANITSPVIKIAYNLDQKGWKTISPPGELQIYVPKTVSQSLQFPADTVAKTIDLAFSGVSFSTKALQGHSILDWRLLTEPVPTPRYYRYFVPLMLYDDMNLLDGHRISREGLAFEMLGDLETLYRNGTAFDFQKPSGYLERTVSTKVRIEEMEFKEFAQTKGASGFGGICLVVMKEVAT